MGPVDKGSWLTIVGLGEDGPDGLSPASRRALEAAEIVIGAARHLDLLPDISAEKRVWPIPFADGVPEVLALRGRPVVVLASGDPMHFGVGATLSARLPAAEMRVHPAPSAFSLAAAALAWPLDGVRCVSLHAAPEAEIVNHAADGARLLVLTRDGEAPERIAATRTAAGCGDSDMHVLAALGSGEEAIRRGPAHSLRGAFHPLNIVAVACVDTGRVDLAGLEHDGCVTRDEIRAITVAALAGGTFKVGTGRVGRLTVEPGPTPRWSVASWNLPPDAPFASDPSDATRKRHG